jgi:hypothetical protein
MSARHFEWDERTPEVLGQRVARWRHEGRETRHDLKRFHEPVGLASARVANSVGHAPVVE